MSTQGRRQDFEWGGALRNFDASEEGKFFKRPTPNLKICRWGANFSLLFFNQKRQLRDFYELCWASEEI